MKAKSWKKLAKNKQEPTSTSLPEFGSFLNQAEDGGTPSAGLDGLAEENDTLRKLLEERQELEQKMARLTGGTTSSTWQDDPRNAFRPVPTMSERREADRAWEARHQAALQRTQQRGRSRHEAAPPASGATPVQAPQPPKEDQRHLQRMQAERNRFAQVPDELAEGMQSFSRHRDAMLEKAKQVKHLKEEIEGTVDKVKGAVDDTKKWLEQRDALKTKSKERSLLDEMPIKDPPLGSEKTTNPGTAAAKLLEAGSTKAKAAIESTPVSKLKNAWEKLRDKQQEATRTKQRYESRIKKALSVDAGSLEELGERQQMLREQALERKRAEKAAERKEEERRQKRKEKKNDRF